MLVSSQRLFANQIPRHVINLGQSVCENSFLVYILRVWTGRQVVELSSSHIGRDVVSITRLLHIAIIWCCCYVKASYQHLNGFVCFQTNSMSVSLDIINTKVGKGKWRSL